MRATATELVPYVECELAHVECELARPGQAGETPAIRDVVVGPTAHPELAEEATAQLPAREGYAEARKTVRRSAIPLRA